MRITASQSARDFIAAQAQLAPDRAWYVLVYRSSPNGPTPDQRALPFGWRVKLESYAPEHAVAVAGAELLPGVRVLAEDRPEAPFPGGEIELLGTNLVFEEHAI